MWWNHIPSQTYFAHIVLTKKLYVYHVLHLIRHNQAHVAMCCLSLARAIQMQCQNLVPAESGLLPPWFAMYKGVASSRKHSSVRCLHGHRVVLGNWFVKKMFHGLSSCWIQLERTASRRQRSSPSCQLCCGRGTGWSVRDSPRDFQGVFLFFFSPIACSTVFNPGVMYGVKINWGPTGIVKEANLRETSH